MRSLLRRNRAHVYATVRKHLRHLDAHPDSPDRAERIAEMVRTTEPLVRLLGQRLVRDDLDNAVMLEVLARRYYGNRGLTGVHTGKAAGCTFVVAERAGSQLVSAAVRLDALDGALRGLAEDVDAEDLVAGNREVGRPELPSVGAPLRGREVALGGGGQAEDSLGRGWRIRP